MENEGFKINLPPEDENNTAQVEENIPQPEAVPPQNNFYPDERLLYGGLTLAEYKEKTDIKHSCRIVGFSFILSMGIMLLINIGIVIATFILSGFSAENLLTEPAINHVLQIVFSILVFMIPFVIIPKAARYRLSDIIPLKRPNKGTFLPLFLFGIAFCSFANIATNIAATYFENMGIDYNVDFGDNPEGIFGFLLTLISTVAVPALVEEFALRGVVQGILKKHGEGFAVLSSAVIFGVMHRNFQQMPFAFLVGLALGYVTVKSGTLWVAVAIHAFNNGISVILDYFGNSLSIELQNVIYTIFLIVTLILGIVALIFTEKSDDFFKFEKSDTIAGEGRKFKWFIFSVPVIIYTILCLLESFLYFFV